MRLSHALTCVFNLEIQEVENPSDLAQHLFLHVRLQVVASATLPLYVNCSLPITIEPVPNPVLSASTSRFAHAKPAPV
jgi:hypothetical protein